MARILDEGTLLPTTSSIYPFLYTERHIHRSRCKSDLFFRSHFALYRETEDNWDVDIADDVKAECSKYGQVIFAYVDVQSKVR